MQLTNLKLLPGPNKALDHAGPAVLFLIAHWTLLLQCSDSPGILELNAFLRASERSVASRGDWH